MRIGAFGLALVALLLVQPPEGRAQEARFDEVVLITGGGQDLLYVVLTDAGGDRADLVVKYARAALRVAAAHKFAGTTKGDEKPKHRGNVVFVIRKAAGDQVGAVSGFGVEQLQEIIAAGPEKGRALAARHAWSLGKVPQKK
jgi:hypothetical protein